MTPALAACITSALLCPTLGEFRQLWRLNATLAKLVWTPDESVEADLLWWKAHPAGGGNPPG